MRQVGSATATGVEEGYNLGAKSNATNPLPHPLVHDRESSSASSSSASSSSSSLSNNDNTASSNTAAPNYLQQLSDTIRASLVALGYYPRLEPQEDAAAMEPVEVEHASLVSCAAANKADQETSNNLSCSLPGIANTTAGSNPPPSSLVNKQPPQAVRDSEDRIAQMAVLIHDSMSASTRRYHNVQHVFDVAAGVADDPIAVLASLFHDSVYFHVDGGLTDLQRQHLHIADASFACDREQYNGSACLPEYRAKGMRDEWVEDDDDDDDDTLLRMVESIFGYHPHSVVTHRNGLNEFLSAVVCVRLLEPLVSLRVLAELACCIEATIPFRPNITVKETNIADENKEHTTTILTPADRLYQNLEVTNARFRLGMTAADMVRAVQRSVRVANEDISNFGTDDVLWFLDNTWDLLPENNEALRPQCPYTVRDFQFAVFKMYGFFNFLNPDVVFQQYKGVPSDQVLAERQKYTVLNLNLGRKYVGAKLLALSVLEAFAQLTGGDAPVSLFMGPLPAPHQPVQCPLQKCSRRDVAKDPTVYKILVEGRRRETPFDVRQSPLAAYLYAYLGDAGVTDLLRKPHDQWDTLYPMTTDTARALLHALPVECVQTLGQCLACMVSSSPRKEAILRLVQEICKPS